MFILEELGSGGGESAPVLIAAVLAFAGLAMALLVMALGKYWVPERNHFFARWGFTRLALVALTYILAQILVPVLWAAATGNSEFSLNENFMIMFLIFLGPGLLIIKTARELDPDGIRCLGFRLPGSGRAYLFGIVAYALLVPGLLASMMLWPAVLEAAGREPETQEVMRKFFDLEGSALWIPVLFAVVIQPFFEELLFRSFLQPLLVQNFRNMGGIGLTSLLFAAPHGLSAFGPVFVLSLIMGGVMQRTQRFSSCYGIHMLHNGLTIWAILTFSEVRELVDVGALFWFF
ncbi:MAG: membrane protease YdiL (CAAX protease family) [Candidatus Paceibacteria bacterium]|jgi:membrane protease YdiL (CAAX protease family)